MKRITPKRVYDYLKIKAAKFNIKRIIKGKRLSFYWNKRHDFYLPIEAFGCDKKTYLEKRNTVFPKKIKFSILVPLYNTPEHFLKEMIGSVIFQCYENWELCLADGSDSEHKYVEEICRAIAQTDNRIKYKKLEKNGGISENTNECIKMATGDYISLFDHDDLLHPFALFETMKAICEKDADFVYTDEAIFKNPELRAITNTNFKPDFSPDYFLGTCYMCHFSSFKKSLLDKTGGFNSETDGAQDYDLFLRLIEQTDKIVHVPKCLYFWRASPASTASGIQSKMYAIEAGKKALENHFKRCNIPAKVEIYRNLLYKVNYTITNKNKVSIIIINNNISALKDCINSIKQKTSYENYEIIIADNELSINSNKQYYDSLKNDKRIKIFNYTINKSLSAINNCAAKEADGEYLLFLDNNTIIETENWIEELLMHAQNSKNGAVGAKLYDEKNRVVHFGYILGLKQFADTFNRGLDRTENGYAFRLAITQNVCAVSSDCMMISKKKFEEMQGFNVVYKESFFDIDLCLRLKEKGYKNVCTPHAELYYRGKKRNPNKNDLKIIYSIWDKKFVSCDPYYNPNLTRKTENFRVIGEVFPQD